MGPTTIQWTNKPAADVLLESNISNNDRTKYQFSVLTAVRHWYDGDPTGQNENYGIMLRYYDESLTGYYNSVYSGDVVDTNSRPRLTISYIPKNSEFTVIEGGIKQLPLPDTTGNITWSSSNTDVVIVTTAGRVIGVKAGQATVTVFADEMDICTYTVYVVIEDGVYYIKNSNIGLYLATNGGVENGIPAKLVSYVADGNARNRQLWKIVYLGEGFYSIRPLCALNMGLHVTSGNVDITQTPGPDDTFSDVTLYSRWQIISSNGTTYQFYYTGESSMAMRHANSAISPGMSVVIGEDTGILGAFNWELTCVADNIVNVDVIYDQAYLNRYDNAPNKIHTHMEKLQEKFLYEFGILVDYTSPIMFSSYADTQCSTSPNQVCTHATNDECSNSEAFTDGTTILQPYHHNNIYNLMLRIPLPDTSQNVLVAYIGHESCMVRKEDGDENGNGLSNEMLHISNPFWGLAYPRLGLSSVTNFSTAESELKTMVHEFGHFYGVIDHYGGSAASTVDMQMIDGRYSRDCIYGENKEDMEVLYNLTICEGCKAKIEANRDKYKHK